MSTAAEHLDAWERAGLIDQVTADRLRAADRTVIEPSTTSGPDAPATDRPRSMASGTFGPPVLIAEAFGYLGAAFLLAAWFAWIVNRSTHAQDPGWVIGIGTGVAAIGLAILGGVLHRGDDRQRRAAGVALLIALSSLGTAAFTLISGAGVGWPEVGVLASAVTLAAAVAFRVFHPAVLTQIGLLSAVTSLAGALLMWFEGTLFGNRSFPELGLPASSPDPLVLVVGSAAWWLSVAVLIGLLGLVESSGAERRGDAAAGRRAGLDRFWAGMTAVAGLASAVSSSDYLGNGEFGRVLAPWIGDLGLLILAAVLIERAFRRESSSYVYAAAFGLIVALSDLNISYLTEGIESAFLVEGLILLAAGIAADRLRRRIGRVDGPPPEPTGTGDEPVGHPIRAEDPTSEAAIPEPIEP
jgi:hypothetical protein